MALQHIAAIAGAALIKWLRLGEKRASCDESAMPKLSIQGTGLVTQHMWLFHDYSK